LALCAFSEASRKFEIGQKVRKKAKESKKQSDKDNVNETATNVTQ